MRMTDRERRTRRSTPSSSRCASRTAKSDAWTKSVEALERDLRPAHRRASPALVERLHVEYYGTPTPLNQSPGSACPRRTRSSSSRGTAAPGRHREGDPEERHRPQPERRRPGGPPRHPAAHRGAPQGAGQGRPPHGRRPRVEIRNIRREAVDSAQARREGGRRGQGRGARPSSPRCRRSPTCTSLASMRPVSARRPRSSRSDAPGQRNGRCPQAVLTSSPTMQRPPAAAAVPLPARTDLPRHIGDHHGRQRTVGPPAPPPARGRSPRRRARHPPGDAGVPPGGRPHPHPLRVQHRELAAAANRGHRAHEAVRRHDRP